MTTSADKKNKAAGAATPTASTSETQNPKKPILRGQCKIAYDALTESPKNTIELRAYYGIMSPHSRIIDLKAKGFDIVSRDINVTTPDGVKHKGVAEYTLVKRADNE